MSDTNAVISSTACGVGHFVGTMTKPWRIDFTCCGREDGHAFADTWDEASAVRESYTSGPCVHPHGYSANDGRSGHRRSAVISRVRLKRMSDPTQQAGERAAFEAALDAAMDLESQPTQAQSDAEMTLHAIFDTLTRERDQAQLRCEEARTALAECHSEAAWTCTARKANMGANDPQDCGYPFCGCSPEAMRALESAGESGALMPSEANNLRTALAVAERELRELARAGDTLSPQEIINHCAAGLGVDRHEYPGDPEIQHRSVIELMGQVRTLRGELATLRATAHETEGRLRHLSDSLATVEEDAAKCEKNLAAVTGERDALYTAASETLSAIEELTGHAYGNLHENDFPVRKLRAALAASGAADPAATSERKSQ